MPRTGRPGLSPQEKSELWNRWKAGQSLSEIGRALGKHAGSVHTVLSANGGIIPRARSRRATALTSREREEISRDLAQGISLRAIARNLGRSASTISREIQRNGGPEKYRATLAESKAWELARRPKPCLLAGNKRLARLVASRLKDNWSPQQISGWLAREHEGNADMQISHETIYRSLFIQARGVLKRELIAHLRSRRMMRRGKTATTDGQPRGRIPDAVSIRDRPACVEDRAVPGHWEGDLLSGARNSHIATLVERQSRYVVLVKLAGKDTNSVINALVREVKKLPDGLMESLTWDRGGEMAQHKRFTVHTDVAMYFCDPQSPWQRGTNENTNRLLRQYLPDGIDLRVYSQRHLNSIARKLNGRPRKTLAYMTPSAKLAQVLQ
jgi:IS30 family transposase